MNNETLAILEKLSSDVVFLKWVWGLSLAFGVVFISIIIHAFYFLYRATLAYFILQIRNENNLKRGELISLRFRGIGNYYDNEDPGIVLSLFLLRADKLLVNHSPKLEKIALKRLRKYPEQLYTRLFLSFFYVDNNEPDKAIDQIKKIRSIRRDWHQEFMKSFMRAVQIRISKKYVIPGGNVYEFKIKK